MAIPNATRQTLIDEAFGGATIEVGLLDTSSGYSFNADTDGTVADLPTGAEPTDASYSRQTLSNVSISQDNTDDEGVRDADDVVFSSLSTANDIQTVFVARQSDGVLIAVYDDDSAGSLADLPKATNGSDFTISFDAEGILNV